MDDSDFESQDPDAYQPDDSDVDDLNVYDSEVDDSDGREATNPLSDGEEADGDENPPDAWIWGPISPLHFNFGPDHGDVSGLDEESDESSIESPRGARLSREPSFSSQATSDSEARSSSEAAESPPQSPAETARSQTWSIDSGSESEIPSSPDSLFVGRHSRLFHLDFDRIEEEIQQQDRELGLQHAELAEFQQQLRQAIASQPAGRQPTAPPPIQRRRRGQAELGSRLDELVEMEFEPRNRRSNRTPGSGGPGPGAGAAVIDLTEEPDSPEDVVILPNPDNNNRNRRGRGRNNPTPSLPRSDGSAFGAAVPVIDLTEMDDDEPAPARALPRNRPGHAAFEIPRHRAEAIIDFLRDEEEVPGGVGEAVFGMVRRSWAIRSGLELNFFQRFLGQAAEMERPNAGGNNNNNNRAVPNPLGENLPNFNYGANGYNNRAPKPPYVPPPPAPEGFTRNTATDQVAVCPNCDQELKYDPEDDKAPPAKRARNKKDRSERHFWVVKDCGHVFCRACFEDRKVTAKNKHKTKFRQHEKKTLCNIDGCESDVTLKTAWVGLFV